MPGLAFIIRWITVGLEWLKECLSRYGFQLEKMGIFPME